MNDCFPKGIKYPLNVTRLCVIAVHALISAVFIQTGKYVPPHLREAADSKRKAELERLKRNLKGLINRYVCVPEIQVEPVVRVRVEMITTCACVTGHTTDSVCDWQVE